MKPPFRGEPEATNAASGSHADPAGLLARGELLAGRYRLDDLLGAGGMGMVYRARDDRLGLDVAVKILRPDMAGSSDFQERFRHEVILARQVSHPNVVRIHDIGQHGELSFLTMDLVDGRSLREILREPGRLPPERAVAILAQVAEALAAAHEQGVVHRDLKPGNVLIVERDKAFITDFGVARSLEGTKVTRSGVVVGTLDYLSPEQAAGSRVDGRSDLYALGLILFESLTGQRPFTGESQVEILAQRVVGRPRDLDEVGAEVPRPLKDVVRRLLQRDPEHRFQSGREVVAALEAADLRALPDRTTLRPFAPTTLSAAAVRPRRRPAWHVGSIVLVLAAAAWAGVLAWNRLRGREPASPVATIERRHALAVLPLRDETGGADSGWLAKGIADRLAARLGECPELRVADSVRVFRILDDLGHEETPLSVTLVGELANLLEADRLITGRLRPARPADAETAQLELELDLVDAAGTVLGSVSATARREELYGVTDELGEALAMKLGATSPGDAPHVPATAAAESHARALDRLGHGDFSAAVPLLESAVEHDPDYARAWLLLAEALHGLGQDSRATDAADRAAAVAGAGRTALEARARRALLRGDAEPHAHLEELAARFPHDVELRLDLAEAYREAGRLEEAAAALLQLSETASGHPRVWYLLALNAILSGDNHKAVDDYLVRALILYTKLGDEHGKGDVSNALGIAFERMGQLGKAAESYEKAVELRRGAGDHRGFASSLNNLAAMYSYLGRQDEARASLERALELCRELDDRVGLAHVYDTYGMVEEENGRYREALEHYRRALGLREEQGDQIPLTDSYSNVGFVFYVLGEYDNAMVYWLRALDLRRTHGDRRGGVVARQNIGLLELARGSWDQALRSFSESLDEARALEMSDGAAVSLGYLGRIAQLRGEFREAFAAYREALEILRRLGDPRGLVEFTLFEADALIELNRLAPARRSLAEAAAWLEETGNQDQLAHLRLLEGRVQRREGDLERSRELFVDAAGLSDASRSLFVGHLSRLELESLPGGDLAVLETTYRELEILGHAQLQLLALEALARAQFSAGRPDAARQATEEALTRVAGTGAWAGAYRLHRLRALALSETGGDPSVAWKAARDEVDRLLGNMDDALRDAFLSLPEVSSVTEGIAAAAFNQ